MDLDDETTAQETPTNVDRVVDEFTRDLFDDTQRIPIREVTILFSDIVSITPFFDKYGDMAGFKRIETHNQMLFPVIEHNGGSVVKTIGDAIMATFDSVEDGVLAAIDMQRALQAYNATKHNEDDKILIRIGLHTGRSIENRKDLFGDSVNVAARISSKADGNQILISEELRSVLNPHICSTRLFTETALKGKREVYRLYDVLWRSNSSDLRFEETNVAGPDGEAVGAENSEVSTGVLDRPPVGALAGMGQAVKSSGGSLQTFEPLPPREERQKKGLSSLAVLAIGIGIGALLTSIAIYVVWTMFEGRLEEVASQQAAVGGSSRPLPAVGLNQQEDAVSKELHGGNGLAQDADTEDEPAPVVEPSANQPEPAAPVSAGRAADPLSPRVPAAERRRVAAVRIHSQEQPATVKDVPGPGDDQKQEGLEELDGPGERWSVSGKKKNASTNPAAMGYLLVNSVPWSKVSVDGKPTGKVTPLLGDNRIALNPGIHRVELEAPNGGLFEYSVWVQPDQEYRLIRKLDNDYRGSLSVVTTPRGCLVYVNGIEQAGRTPINGLALEEGEYRLTVYDPNATKKQSRIVKVRKGSTTTVSLGF